MTGYGRGVSEGFERKITVELKSVNHRSLDLTVKLPRNLNYLDEAVRRTVSERVFRGHVEAYISYEDNRAVKGRVGFDRELAAQYLEIGRALEEAGFTNDLTASQILKMPDVLKTESVQDDEKTIIDLTQQAAAAAADALIEMRKHEGKALYKDVYERFNNLSVIVSEIEKRAPLVAENYSAKLAERIKENLNGVELDLSRLYNEVAFFADKSNIDEELARLKGHIDHGKALMDKQGCVGEALDFLAQELMREANTAGSKSNDLELTRFVLDAKNEIKKIKEQIQNIE